MALSRRISGLSGYPVVGLRPLTLIGLIVLAVAMGCSASEPASRPAAAIPVAPKITTRVTASVLITDEPEHAVPIIDSVRVSPSAIVVDPGEIVQLSAEAFGVDGRPLTDIEFVWTAADPRAGSITRDGSYQGGTTPGVFGDSMAVTGIQNALHGVRYATAFVSITVVGELQVPTLASVAIIPEEPTLFEKQIYRLRAMGFDQDGLIIPGVRFVWNVVDPELGRVNELGLLTVRGHAGTYEQAVSVAGLWEGERASATIDVNVVSSPEADDYLNVHALPQRFYLDPGDRMQLRAVALNGLGELVAGTELRWVVQDPSVGTIDGNGNFIAGDQPGIYTEAVMVEAVIPGERGFVRAVDFASVVVRQKTALRHLSAVSVRPGTVVVAPGGRVTLAARAVDEFGESPRDVTIAWEVLRPEAGSISEFGVFTALWPYRIPSTPGTYPDALRVTVEQQVDDQTITRHRLVNVVITGTLSSAEISPALGVVAPGQTVHFSLTGWDENGVKLPGLVVIWRVTDESVGTVDAFGNFTAGQAAGLYEGAIVAEISQTLPDLR